MLRAIREIQPRWIVGENVRGLTNWNGGVVFDEVQSDLEAQGYEVTPFLLPACAVNAPHRRDRIWFVAYNSNARLKGVQFGGENRVYESEITTNSTGIGQPRKEHGKTERRRATKTSVPNDWKNFPTQSPIYSGNDGFSNKLDGITLS